MKTIVHPLLGLLLVTQMSLTSSPAATVLSGSPYSNNLGSYDAANFTFLWEGSQVMGEGNLSQWSFWSSTAGRSITPLLIKQTGVSYNIEAVGTTRFSIGASAHETYDFAPVSGNVAINSGGAEKYFLGWSFPGNGPVTYNGNPLAVEGMNLRFVSGATTSTGPVSFTGTSARHYAIRGIVEQAPYIREAVGETLMRRAIVDNYANGFIVSQTPFSESGAVSRILGFADFDGTASTSLLTPYIFRESGGNWSVYGVGETLLLGDGFFDQPFRLAQGSNLIDALSGDSYYYGWRYGNADGSGGGPGNLPFHVSGPPLLPGDYSFFNPGALGVNAGYTVAAFQGTQNRDYSVRFLVTPEPGRATLSAASLALLILVTRRRPASSHPRQPRARRGGGAAGVEKAIS